MYKNNHKYNKPQAELKKKPNRISRNKIMLKKVS